MLSVPGVPSGPGASVPPELTTTPPAVIVPLSNSVPELMLTVWIPVIVLA